MDSWTAWAEVLRPDVPLAARTTFGVGGPARYLLTPRSLPELARLLHFLRSQEVPVYFLGNGSNLLVDDRGVDGAVVSLTGLRRLRRLDAGEIEVEAGCRLPALLRWAERQGLSGLERCAGIPGTVGGAVKLNAGGREGCFGDLLVGATLVTPAGEVVWRRAAELGLGYRSSRLGGAVVAAVRLRLDPAPPAAIRARTEGLLRRRRATQPLQARSAGCIFKNPPDGRSAGRLLEEAGMKGRRRGRATVSDRHANFIVNQGGATAHDVRDLIREGQERVLDRFGVLLVPEVVAWP